MQGASDTEQAGPTSAQPSPQPLWLGLPWVLAMALIGAIAGIVAYAFRCGTGFVGVPLFLILLPLAGAGLGVIQQLVVKSFVSNAERWVPFSIGGWIAGLLAGLIVSVLCLAMLWFSGADMGNPPLIGLLRSLQLAIPGLLTFVVVLSFLQTYAFPAESRASWWVPANLGGFLLGLIVMALAQPVLETVAGYSPCGGSIGGLNGPLNWVLRLALGGLVGGLAALPLGILTGAVLLGLRGAIGSPAAWQRWLPRLATLGLLGLSLPLWYPRPSAPTAPVAQLRTVPCWYTGPTNDYGLGKLYGEPATGKPDEGYYQPPLLRCSDRTADSPEGRWRWAEGDYQPGWALESNLQQAGAGRTPGAPQPSQYELGRLEAGGTVIAAGWLAGGRELFAATAEAGLRVWASEKPEAPRDLVGAAVDLQAAAVSPDGRALLIADRSESPRLIEAAGGRELASLKHAVMLGERITGVYFSPDGRSVLAAWTDGNLRVWDLASGAETLDLWGHERITGVVMAPNGRTIVSAQFDRGLQIWDVATGKDTRLIGPGRYRVTSLAISPDGASLLSGSADGIVRRWELASGQQLGDLIQPFDTPVMSLAISPDGRTALAGAADGTIVQWDLASGRELRRLAGHSNMVTSLAFHPDGTTALSGSWDGTLRIWRVE